MKINIVIENFCSIFGDLNDKQRIEIIKEIIWCAPDAFMFVNKLKKELNGEKFLDTLD